MKIYISLLSILFLLSCQDLKKDEQITKLNALQKTNDSIREVFYKNKIDTIDNIIFKVREVEFRIKHNYVSDTIDRQKADKINEYKTVRKKLKHAGKYYNQLERGTKEESETLKKLKTDIESGAGEIKKYDEYISFERNKVNQLNLILKDYVSSQSESLISFNKLHSELTAFSLSLLKK
jgi:hypothetical protein